MYLLSCVIPYRITLILLSFYGRAWKVDGRAQALVGPGLATTYVATFYNKHVSI